MAVVAYLQSLSEAASSVGSYFGGNHRPASEGGCRDSSERYKGGAQNPKAEAAKRPRTAVERPRFAPEFDGLNCFETLVSH
ncbi:unnamed protein product [Victoria cruziana]